MPAGRAENGREAGERVYALGPRVINTLSTPFGGPKLSLMFLPTNKRTGTTSPVTVPDLKHNGCRPRRILPLASLGPERWKHLQTGEGHFRAPVV